MIKNHADNIDEVMVAWSPQNHEQDHISITSNRFWQDEHCNEPQIELERRHKPIELTNSPDVSLILKIES